MEVQSIDSMEDVSRRKNMRKLLLFLSGTILCIGACGGPLIMRLYFLHGGKRIWLSSFLETGGWPIILIPLVVTYIRRLRTQGSQAKIIFMKPFLFLAAAIVGGLTGLDDYLYAYGVSKLPVTTTSLITSSHLAFTAGFAFLLVKQMFSAYSINAVVLLTVGAAVLALHTSGDKPQGEKNEEYVLGFVLTLGAAALYGFVLPLVELTYAKSKQTITYTLVLEYQIVMSFFATAFCVVGMFINDDFQAISREAREFGLGESKYYVILVSSAILWQCFFLGAIGVIFCTSSLLSGILIAVMLPTTEILAVIFYHENFQAEKIVALILSLWGFMSYFYGEKKLIKERKQMESHQRDPQTTEMMEVVGP